MKHNTGEAILILGAIYLFTITEGWTRYLLFILVGIALGTWSVQTGAKEQKELIKTTTHKLKLEIQLIAAQTKFYVAQGLAIMRNLKGQ